MATVVFDNNGGVGDSLWSTNTNWVGDALPGDTDTAQISADCQLDMDDTVAVCTVDPGKTLTIKTGYTLTAGALSGAASGQTYVMEAGSGLTITTTAFTHVGTLKANGTSGSRCTIQRSGAPTNYAHIYDRWEAAFCDIIGISVQLSSGWLEDCVVQYGRPSASGVVGDVSQYTRLERCYIYDCSAGLNISFSDLELIDCVFGYDEDGVAAPNAYDIRWDTAAGRPVVRGRSILCGSTTQISGSTATLRRAWFDNWGYVDPAMCPAGSALESANGKPGVWRYDTQAGYVYRATTNPKSGETYHARVVPSSICADDEGKRFDLDIWLPIQTGDNCEVSVYGYNHGLTASDCAEVMIDPEGSWFTPQTAEPTWTADNWVQANPSASGAGGSSDKGAVHIVLRVKDYAAGSYFDWSNATITCGGKTYTVTYQR